MSGWTVTNTRAIFLPNVQFIWLALLFIWMCWKTYFAQWVVCWWWILSRPLRATANRKMTGNVHCFFPLFLFYPWTEGKSQSFAHVFQQQIFTILALFFLKNEKKTKKKKLRLLSDTQASFALSWTYVLYLAHQLSTWMCLATLPCSFWLIHKCYTVGLKRQTQLLCNLSKVPPANRPFNFYDGANQSYRRDPWMLTEVSLLKI